MAYANRMTSLVNKIEIRLGTRPLNLPKELQKDKWPEIIKEQSLVSFSRYYPYKFPYTVERDTLKDGYYLIDEKIISGNTQILGIRDIKWNEMTPNSSGINNQPYGQYDFYTNDYNLDDFCLMQLRANQLSLFNNGFFVDFVPPNKIAVKNASGTNVMLNLPAFKVELFLVHPETLITISPTKMETFEALAQADVATFLYEELKYYENLETVFGSTNMRLDSLQEKANKREDVINTLNDGYISAGNEGEPIIYTI